MGQLSMDPETSLYRRIAGAGASFLGVVGLGAVVFRWLGQGAWSWGDCLYMTVITLSTVGFAEVLDGMDGVQGARAWTVVLIVLGSGTLLYFASTLTAIFIEGDLQGTLRRRKMQKKIDSLRDHVVVCGVGSTGVFLVEELRTFHEPFVVVDHDEARLLRVQEEIGYAFSFVVGDATDDATLQLAGIENARGVLAALHDDKDNIFVTITARALNSRARIVAKAVEASAEAKLKRAGADSVVSPNYIGGMRMAGEMIRPSVVEFLDRLMRDREMKLRIDEWNVGDDSRAVGISLAESGIREAGALVLCAKEPNGGYAYNPQADYRIQAGTTLILIGSVDDLLALRSRYA